MIIGKPISQMNDKEADIEMAERRGAYAALWPKAIEHLKGVGEPLTALNIRTIQDALAIDICLVPPHWLGWVECSTCGFRPAEPEIRGNVVEVCRWCHMRDDLRCQIDVSWIGYRNYSDFVQRNAEEKLLEDKNVRRKQRAGDYRN